MACPPCPLACHPLPLRRQESWLLPFRAILQGRAQREAGRDAAEMALASWRARRSGSAQDQIFRYFPKTGGAFSVGGKLIDGFPAEFASNLMRALETVHGRV